MLTVQKTGAARLWTAAITFVYKPSNYIIFQKLVSLMTVSSHHPI